MKTSRRLMGRPKQLHDRVRVVVYLERETHDWLRDRDPGLSVSAYIRALVERSVTKAKGGRHAR